MRSSVSLETVAEITADLDARGDRDAVLAEHGLDGDAFEAARTAWMRKVAERAAHRDFALGLRWASALATAQRAAVARARARDKRRGAEGPLPVAPQVRSSLRTRRAAVAPPHAAPAISAPAAAVPVPTAAPARVAVTAFADETAPMPPVAPPGAPRRSPKTMMTNMASLAQASAPLPFAGRPPARTAAAPSSRPPSGADMPFAVPVVAVPKPALLPTAAHGPLVEPPPPTPARREDDAKPPTAPRRSPKTMNLDSAMVLAAVTPFLRAHPVPPSVRTPPPPASARASASAPVSPSSGTPGSISAVEARRRAEVFTLAQYARLAAGLRLAPERATQLREAYGIDPDTWTTLHQVWQERFRATPALKERWQAQVEQILARLRAGQP